MDFPSDYVYPLYPTPLPAVACQVVPTLQHHYCGNVFVVGTLYTDHAPVVDPAVYQASLADDCSCCNDRWFRVSGSLLVTGQLTVGNAVTVTPTPNTHPCCYGQMVVVNGDLTVTNSVTVLGQTAPLPAGGC